MVSPLMDLVCWKCGASLDEVPQPFGRLAECLTCHAELHVCRMCEFYDTAVAKHCRETVAEEVKEKERANFCDYYQPRPDAYMARDTGEADRSRAELDALFGSGEASTEDSTGDSGNPLDALFKK